MMKRKQKYDTPLRIICAVLFATFSFLYIYMFQGELLALVQDHLSKGKTTNNAFVTALLITLLLMALQYFLNKLGKLHGCYEAVSYLPACLILALIARVDGSLTYSWVHWVIALIAVAVIYVLVVWIDRNTLQLRDIRLLKQLTPNLGLLAVMFVLTGWYGNDTPAEKMELAAWKYTHSGEYDKVLAVGLKSEDCNATLTALRNLALAKTGQLGNKLFAYPQPYGADGLLLSRYNVQTPEYGAKEFYRLLGDTPYGGERSGAFYKRMMQKKDSAYCRELYGAALLLDKDLEGFVALTVDRIQLAKSLTAVPVHYQEAWMVYNEQHPFHPVTFIPDSAVAQRHQEYLSLREANAADPIALQNFCKRKFGDTYWYYYDFVFK